MGVIGEREDSLRDIRFRYMILLFFCQNVRGNSTLILLLVSVFIFCHVIILILPELLVN